MKVSMVSLLAFSYFFLQGKVFCFGMRRQVAYKMLMMCSDPCRKNYISSSI